MRTRLKAKLILSFLKRAHSEELGMILKYILYRYSEQHPDHEFIFLSLPKDDPQERDRILDALRLITENRPSSN